MGNQKNKKDIVKQRNVVLATLGILLISLIAYEVFVADIEIRNILVRVGFLVIFPGVIIVSALILKKLHQRILSVLKKDNS